jgi:hypothetical protein
MAVRAKFYVRGITRQAYNPAALEVTLSPVTRGESNKEWSAATPSGEIKMTITNPPAADYFGERLGKELYVDFTEVPEDESEA